ncbi:hypothetical protein PMIN05_006395 [Paraphaeosphaeria minitans]
MLCSHTGDGLMKTPVHPLILAVTLRELHREPRHGWQSDGGTPRLPCGPRDKPKGDGVVMQWTMGFTVNAMDGRVRKTLWARDECAAMKQGGGRAAYRGLRFT